MSILANLRGLSLAGSFIRLNISGLAGQTAVAGSTIQVRTATKKVAGSRTNMRDSAGRRLGAKAAENEPVKTGQILMRQRGTRFYPGENAAIGKDHTIYATEPGYVRFYLDPFHPKRKFIGVALGPDLRLPTEHFEPRVRRLGYVAIEDTEKAQFEEANLSRKDHLARPQILKSLKEREEKRSQKLSTYADQLQKLVPSLTETDVSIASERFLSVLTQYKNGITLPDAQATTTSIYFQNLKLKLKNDLISEGQYEELKSQYLTLIDNVDKLVSFDNKYNLINYISEPERIAQVQQLESKLEELFQEKSKKNSQLVQKLISTSNLLNGKEKNLLTSKYLRSFLLESKIADNKTLFTKRWNHDKKRVEEIARP